MSHQQEGARSEEYPIRALVKHDAVAYPQNNLGRGAVIAVKRCSSPRCTCRGYWAFGEHDQSDLFFAAHELIFDPTPEQIAEERAKAGLPPLETPQASPEPVRAEGPDPLVEALDVIEKALHTGVARSIKKEEAIYSDAFSALMRLRSSATLSRTQGAV